jgi:hypothetical protein
VLEQEAMQTVTVVHDVGKGLASSQVGE